MMIFLMSVATTWLEDALLIFLTTLFLLFLVGVGAAWYWILQIKMFDWAEKFAQRHGLELRHAAPLRPKIYLMGEPALRPEFVSTFQGRFLRIQSAVEWVGKFYIESIRVELFISNPEDLWLKVRPRASLPSQKFLDIVTESEKLDRIFAKCLRVTSSDPQFLQKALIPELKRPVLSRGLWGQNATLAVSGSSVIYTDSGSLLYRSTRQRIERWLPIMVAWAAIPAAYRR